MMNVKEIEVKITEEKAKLAKFETAYEAETEETKLSKLEFFMMRKEEVIEKLVDRQQALLEREAQDEEEGKDIKDAEEDDDVCPACGGDLVQVDEDGDDVAIFECVKCKELFLDN